MLSTPNPESEWPFTDPANTACIVCRHVVEESQPVRFASHDAEDGSWQFLCGAPDHVEEDAKVTGLGTVLRIAPDVREVADLPPGTFAERDDSGRPWSRYRDDR